MVELAVEDLTTLQQIIFRLGIFGITEDLIKMTLYRQPLLKIKIMKKCLLILTTILCFNSTYSQALYTENFDNYNIGNLGIDPSGITPGQGGWLTENFTGTTAPSNSYFSIISEPTKGNVLMLSSSGATSNDVGVIAKKVNIDSLINLRTPGNNVIKFEIDYYTGTNQP